MPEIFEKCAVRTRSVRRGYVGRASACFHSKKRVPLEGSSARAESLRQPLTTRKHLVCYLLGSRAHVMRTRRLDARSYVFSDIKKFAGDAQLSASAFRFRSAEPAANRQSQAIKMAVLPPCRANERSHFLFDFAVTAKKILTAVSFEDYARFRAFNIAAIFYPSLLHYTTNYRQTTHTLL